MNGTRVMPSGKHPAPPENSRRAASKVPAVKPSSVGIRPPRAVHSVVCHRPFWWRSIFVLSLGRHRRYAVGRTSTNSYRAGRLRSPRDDYQRIKLVVFFSFVYCSIGVIVASVITRVANGRLVQSHERSCFYRKLIPLVARPEFIWGRWLSLRGWSTKLRSIGLDHRARAWHGRFDWHCLRRLIGIWVLLGFALYYFGQACRN